MAKQTPTQKPEEITPAAKEIPAQTPLPTETTLEPKPSTASDSPEMIQVLKKRQADFDAAFKITPDKRRELDTHEKIRKTRRFLEWYAPAILENFDKATPAEKANTTVVLERQFGKSIHGLVPSVPKAKSSDQKGREMLLKAKGQREA